MRYYLDYLSYYSGGLAILFTWLVVVYLYIIARKKHLGVTLSTFSDAASLPKFSVFMNTVIVLIGFFQLLFLPIIKSNLILSLAENGLYIIGSIVLILIGLFRQKTFPVIHFVFTRIYILTMTISLFIISLSIGWVSLLVVMLMFFGVLFLVLEKKNFMPSFG